jgi:hypothetical protein
VSYPIGGGFPIVSIFTAEAVKIIAEWQTANVDV